MTFFTLLGLAGTIWSNKTGNFSTVVSGHHVNVTITEVASNTPVTKFSILAAFQLAEEILGAQPGTWTFKLGTNEYQIAVVLV